MELQISKKYKTIETEKEVLLPKRFCCKKMQQLLSMFHYGFDNSGKNHYTTEMFDDNIAVYRMFNYWIEEFKLCPFCGEKLEIRIKS